MSIKTAYDKTTGEILHTISGDMGFIVLDESDPNVGYVDGHGSLKTQRVEQGKIIDKPENEVESMEIEQGWIDLRKMRLILLQQSDWTQIPDTPINATTWTSYRQQLRDITKDITDPREVVWPTPPS